MLKACQLKKNCVTSKQLFLLVFYVSFKSPRGACFVKWNVKPETFNKLWKQLAGKDLKTNRPLQVSFTQAFKYKGTLLLLQTNNSSHFLTICLVSKYFFEWNVSWLLVFFFPFTSEKKQTLGGNLVKWMFLQRTA